MLKNKSTKNKTSKESLKKPEVFIMTQSNTEELKNARSATTGEEFTTLDERIDCEVDRLNKKIEVSMLKQEDKESHVTENTVEGVTSDMFVKGRTLQNLVISGDQKGVINKSMNSNSRIHNRNIAYNLTAGKTYVGYINVTKYEGNITSGLRIYGKVTGSAKTIANKVGWNRFTWNIPIDVASEIVGISIYIELSDFNNGGIVEFDSLMLFEEGSKTDNLTKYFEGIKSFGEAEGKISILSHGKNFINLNERKLQSAQITITDQKANEVTLESNSNNGYIYINLFNIKVSKNTNYVVGCKFENIIDGKYRALKIFGNSTNILLKEITNNDYSVINTGDNENLQVYLYTNRGSNITGNDTHQKIRFYDIMIAEGSDVNSYTPYQEDKKDILLPFQNGLKGIGNICDELVSSTKKAIERIGIKVYNGSESEWRMTNDDKLVSTIQFYLETSNYMQTHSNLICDKLPFVRDRINVDGIEGISKIGGNNTSIWVTIQRDKLTTKDVVGFKAWLQANPLTVYYELAEPIEIPLDENINPKTFNEKTYVSFENAISGTSSFKAPVDTIGTIDRLNRENRALEEENKNLRQDFESTTLVLTDSDLELVKQNVDMDFRLMEVEFALDIPLATLSSNIKFKNKKGEVKSMARSPYEMMKIVILSGDYDKEDYMYKVGKYYERGRMTKEEHDELVSLMTADEVINK